MKISLQHSSQTGNFSSYDLLHFVWTNNFYDSMKAAAILLGVLVAAVAVNAECPVAQMITKNIEECKESLNVSDEVLELVNKGEGDDNKEVSCFYACLISKLGLGTTDLDLDKMEELLLSAENADEKAIEETMELMEECKEEAEVSDDECDVAGRYVKCFREAMKEAEKDEK